MCCRKCGPRIFRALLQAKTDAPLVGIHFEHLNLDLLTGLHDLRGSHVLRHPAHLRHVHQSFDTGLKLYKGAIVGDICHFAGEAHAWRIFCADALPRVRLQLLHAEADPLRLLIDFDDLHRDLLANRKHLCRMADASPGYIGDMQQTVYAAEIDERTVIGDVFHRALDDLFFLKARHERGPLFGPPLLEHSPPGDDDIAAAPIHLQDLEQLRLVHQRADVAHRSHIHLAAGKERDRAVEIDREAALHATENDTRHARLIVECLLDADPAFLAPRLVAGEYGFAERVLDTLDIHLYFVARFDVGQLARHRKFLERHAALGLQAHVYDSVVVLDCDYGAAYHATFLGRAGLETCFEHRCEIVAARGGNGFGNCCHVFSFSKRLPAA